MGHHDVGDALRLSYETRDEDGNLVNASTITLTITKPDLTTDTPTVTNPPAEKGKYEVDYLLAAAGRYTFRWLTTVPNTAEAFEFEAVLPGNPPTLQNIKDYLDSTQAELSATYTDAVLTDAFNAEKAAQRRMCRIPAYYPDDLAQGLKRRVQRNLAMRNLPLAVLQGDAETGSSMFLPRLDVEIRRFEGGHRKVVLG